MLSVSAEDVRASMQAFIEGTEGILPSERDVLNWCGMIGSDNATREDVITSFQVIRKAHFWKSAPDSGTGNVSGATGAELDSHVLRPSDVILSTFPHAVISTIHRRFLHDSSILAEAITLINLTGTTVAALTLYTTTSLPDLIVESVLANTEFLDTIVGTVVALDLLDLLSKLAQIDAPRKRILLSKEFASFLAYMSDILLEKVKTTGAFVDLICDGPFDDPQDTRNVTDTNVKLLHTLDKTCYIFVIQRFCGCAYVVSLTSIKAVGTVARTRVPALALKLLTKSAEVVETGVLEVKKGLFGPLETLNRTLAGALAVVISLIRTRNSAKTLQHYNIIPAVLQLLKLYTANTKESVISNEVCSFSCMLLSTFASFSRSLGEQLHEAHALSLFCDVISTCDVPEMVAVFRSAMASLIELSNALRGTFGFRRMSALFTDIQANTVPPCKSGKELIDGILTRFMLYKDDDESVLYFSQFIQLYTAGSASQDFIRQWMFVSHIPQVLMDCCNSDKLAVVVKTRCVNSLANLVRLKATSKDDLLVTIPAVLSFALQFMKACNQKASDPNTDIVDPTTSQPSAIPMRSLSAEYRRCGSACKEVLEILGHSEGRNKVKVTMYSMLFTGFLFIVASVIAVLFPNKLKRSYFD